MGCVQETNLTFYSINPCSNESADSVSLLKSDIYAVQSDFTLCNISFEEAQSIVSSCNVASDGAAVFFKLVFEQVSTMGDNCYKVDIANIFLGTSYYILDRWKHDF